MSMTLRLGVLMDPISQIDIKKDSTFALLLEAQRRGWPLAYFEQRDLELRDGRPTARMRSLSVEDNATHWYELGAPSRQPLKDLDVVLMRKDPPFDMEYVVTTYFLERAEAEGVLVLNRPRSLRDVNEKVYTAWFPRCTPPTTIARDWETLRQFWRHQGEIILKPLSGMGGASVFRLSPGDPNFNVVVETLTDHGRRFVMAQRFIPEIAEGDKRILLVDGKPIPHALARVPPEGDTRGNLAVGAVGRGVDLTERDRWICDQVGPPLADMGLLFVGLDVIGDYLTEINVTSPTCIRELDAIYGLNIAAQLLDVIEHQRLADEH
jgi:glutathione synthase